jgi:hypothetical protein
MLNDSNFDLGGLALTDPLHRFPAARHVQPKLPIVFVSRHSGVVPASRCFVLKQIASFHLKHRTKNSPFTRRATNADGVYLFPNKKEAAF